MKKTLFSFLLILQFVQSQSEKDLLFLGLQKKNVVTYGVAAYSLLSFYVEYKWWWEGNYHEFRYENDGFLNNYSLGVDKAGHLYISHLYFHLAYNALQWGLGDNDLVLWIAAALPAFNALSIEIADGFSTYAFSNADLLANSLGLGYGILQKKVSLFQNFALKWSYYPSGTIPFDQRFRITDDYDGHIYWVSINVHNLLPQTWQDYYPKFLNLAIGYGGKNISGRPAWIRESIYPQGTPKRMWAFGIDYNLSSLVQEDSFLKTVSRVLDNFKFPGPAVRSIQDQRTEFKPLLLN